jgi:hypothetical protein
MCTVSALYRSGSLINSMQLHPLEGPPWVLTDAVHLLTDLVFLFV